MPPIASVEVADAKPGEGAVRRAYVHPDRLSEVPIEGIKTVHDVLLYNARTHGTKEAFGWRDIVETHTETKKVTKNVGGKQITEDKKWTYFELSDFKYLNFIQLKDVVQETAKGLVSLDVNKGDVFNIYAATSLNWQIMQHACAQTNVTIATAYDTLGESGLLHALNEPECVGIFTNAELLPTLGKIISNAHTIRAIIYDGEPAAGVLDKLRVRDEIRIMSLTELQAAGKNIELSQDRLPGPDDVACIMYTSGTTGAPKGVVLQHSNLIAAVAGIKDMFKGELKPEDYFLAFLPLAHILEFIVELAVSFIGMTTGYGRIRTLTDDSVRNCQGDISAFRPTIMVGVPAIWETIRKGIVGKVNKSGTITRSVFNGALTVKRNVPALGGVVDRTVLKQVKARTGGRLRLALSGGAALSRETQDFLSLALVTVLQGYGLTESVGMCAIVTPEYFSLGHVGMPVPALEVKLVDHPEAGYLSTNNPSQGEILIRGNSITKGYYKRPDLNSDPSIFTEDGWFRTGDIGQWNPDGTLSLVDRIKNLVKLSGGEYIALERLESVYKSCNLVGNICVHGHSDAKQPIAIIFPHEANLRHALSNDGGANKDKDLATLCKDKSVQDMILKGCNDSGKRSGFKSMEILSAVVLTPDEWTPQSGLVTAAQKLQRKKIEEAFKGDIDEAYKSSQ